MPNPLRRLAWKLGMLRRSPRVEKLQLRAARTRGRLSRADIAIFHDFVPPPAGGGNQFLRALRDELQRRGLRVETNRISRTTRACLFNSFNFDRERLEAFRRPGCRLVHRVDGLTAVYRGYDDGTDGRVADANRALADATIAQSQYSLEAHRARGIDLVRPVVIPNAVDPAIFHPRGRRRYSAGRPLRLIATSWSNHPNKGGETFEWMDRNLDWSRYEMTFVGRTSAKFQHIRLHRHVGSNEVARILRDHDVYLMASLEEACSNALLEALACGLPALYRRSGSNGELVAQGGLGFDDDTEIPEQLERLADEYQERQAQIAVTSLAEVCDHYLSVLEIDGAR